MRHKKAPLHWEMVSVRAWRRSELICQSNVEQLHQQNSSYKKYFASSRQKERNLIPKSARITNQHWPFLILAACRNWRKRASARRVLTDFCACSLRGSDPRPEYQSLDLTGDIDYPGSAPESSQHKSASAALGRPGEQS